MRANIPNCLTCCNLICGCIAVVFAMSRSFELSLLFILLGAAFDFSDGFVARLLGVSSPIGKELDSLADVVTFGVAPSAMLFSSMSAALPLYVAWISFLLAAFSALRLAKFNLDTRQATSFIGLPTPANALFWASLLAAYGWWLENCALGVVLLIALMLISCFLLVSEIPMFAMKFKSWGLRDEGNRLKYGFLLFSIIVFILTLIVGKVAACFAIIFLAYILLSVVLWLKAR